MVSMGNSWCPHSLYVQGKSRLSDCIQANRLFYCLYLAPGQVLHEIVALQEQHPSVQNSTSFIAFCINKQKDYIRFSTARPAILSCISRKITFWKIQQRLLLQIVAGQTPARFTSNCSCTHSLRRRLVPGHFLFVSLGKSASALSPGQSRYDHVPNALNVLHVLCLSLWRAVLLVGGLAGTDSGGRTPCGSVKKLIRNKVHVFQCHTFLEFILSPS